MDPELTSLVCFQLCHIVSDIVHQFERRWAEHSVKAAPYKQCHNMAICKSEVSGSSHCGDIVSTGVSVGGQIGEHFSSFGHFRSSGGDTHILVCDFISESARAGVYHNNDLILEKAEGLCQRLIKDFLNVLNLNKVVSTSECAELGGTFLYRDVRHRSGV